MRCVQHDGSRWTNGTIETLCGHRASIERTRVINSSCGPLPHNGVKIPSAAFAMYNLNFFFFFLNVQTPKNWLVAWVTQCFCQFSHSVVLTGCLLRQHFVIHCTHSLSNAAKTFKSVSTREQGIICFDIAKLNLTKLDIALKLYLGVDKRQERCFVNLTSKHETCFFWCWLTRVISCFCVIVRS